MGELISFGGKLPKGSESQAVCAKKRIYLKIALNSYIIAYARARCEII